MRTGNYLFSLVHLFVVLLMISMGLFFVFLPTSPEFRFVLARLLSESSAVFPKIGFSLVGFGVLLLFGFYILNKKSYIKYKLSCHKTVIEEAVIEEYVKKYFKEIFPKQDVVSEIVIKGPKSLEVVACFPEMQEKEKENLLQRVQNELGVLLARKLGYEKEFFLTLNS